MEDPIDYNTLNLNEEEVNLLNDNYNIRKQLVDKKLANGDIKTSAELEAVNSILDSMDKQILERVNLRHKEVNLKQKELALEVKKKENENKEVTLELIASMFRDIHKQEQLSVDYNRDVDIEDEYVPIVVVEGELDLTPADVNLKDILTTESEEEEEDIDG